MEDVVSVDVQKVLDQARNNRNAALDQAELNAAMVTQLRLERRELQLKVQELEEKLNG